RRTPNDVSIEHACRQIAIAPIAHNEYDGGVLDTLGYPQGGNQRSSGRYAAEDAFFRRQAARHVFGFSLSNQFELIDLFRMVDGGLVGFGPFAYAWNLRTFSGLRANNLHGLVFGSQVIAYAHDGSRRAHGADEMGDLAIGLLPQLGACSFKVR